MKAILGSITLLLSSAAFAGDFAHFYESDHDGFWKQWTIIKDAAITCTDEKETGKYLSSTVTTLRIVEVSEANAEIIENLALEDPRCLLNGLAKLTDENAFIIIKKYLVSTLFKSPNEIEASLSKVWNEDKYSRLRENYAKAKENN